MTSNSRAMAVRQHHSVAPAREAAARIARGDFRGLRNRESGSQAVVQGLDSSPRQLRQRQTLAAMVPAFGAPVLQREAEVDSRGKLAFFIDEMRANAKARFTNANEEQLDAFLQYVNGQWDGAYSDDSAFTLAAARKSWSPKEGLRVLGKDQPEQKHYQWLAEALNQTFADDTDIRYGISIKPGAENPQFPASSNPWLNQLKDEGLIEPEVKSGDPKLMNCQLDNIKKTGADSADTATALYTLDPTGSEEPEINELAGAWELHGHVKASGAVAFAHTKRDGKHAGTVNAWFADSDNIPIDERRWSKP